MKYHTLDRFIRDTESMMGVAPNELYVRLSRITLSCLEDLYLHVVPNIRSTLVTINDMGVATIPDDVVEVIKAGVLMADKKLLPLKKTSRLYNADEFKDICTKEPYPTPNEQNDDYNIYHNYYWQHDFIGEFYGWTQDYFPQGGYWHDEKNNRLIFTPNGWAVKPGDKVIIEYQSTIGSGEMKIIPIDATMMLRYYVLHQFYLTSNVNQSEMYRKLFRGAERQYKKRRAEVTPEQVINVLRGTTQAAKYD